MNELDFELIHHLECLFSLLFCVEKKFCNSFLNFLLKRKRKRKRKRKKRTNFLGFDSKIFRVLFFSVFVFVFSLFWFWGRMSDGGEEEWKARILVDENLDYLVRRLNETTSKVIFLIQENLSEEELALPFDGALYLPKDLHFFSTKRLDEEVESFEKFVSFVDGLEGKCLAIWVDADDWDMKDTMVEKLRLKERNCEWCWDYLHFNERSYAVYLRICKFFEEKTQQQCQIKPAKR